MHMLPPAVPLRRIWRESAGREQHGRAHADDGDEPKLRVRVRVRVRVWVWARPRIRLWLRRRVWPWSPRAQTPGPHHRAGGRADQSGDREAWRAQGEGGARGRGGAESRSADDRDTDTDHHHPGSRGGLGG